MAEITNNKLLSYFKVLKCVIYGPLFWTTAASAGHLQLKEFWVITVFWHKMYFSIQNKMFQLLV